MKAWWNVLKSAPYRILAKIAAPFVVPFLSPSDRINHPVFGVDDATDLSYTNIAWRNGAHNYTNRPQVEWVHAGGAPDLEHSEGVKWRVRESADGQYVSFRVVWGEARQYEFYAGWTMNNTPRMRLTFQLRMKWQQWLLLVLSALAIYYGVAYA